jgi:leucyl aminopeptidase
MQDPGRIILSSTTKGATAIHPVSKAQWAGARDGLPRRQRRWAERQGFAAEPGSLLMLPGEDGSLSAVFAGIKEDDDGLGLARLCRQLPEGVYAVDAEDLPLLELGWGLEAYAFERFKPANRSPARLVCRKMQARARLISQLAAVYHTRDLINTPANELGPDELETAARDVARGAGAKFAVIKGPALKRGFPLIHSVGAASPRAPRLIDFTWGPPRAPKVTLVGKGVCFDTGGLDIKPASGMALMKKDMGGAANVLGLARMIMEAKLKLRLRVLIPAVENAIAGEAFRPGDVFKSRKGLTVEIGNTDAEGRLILADALSLADEERPDLLIDMATLTGAARVALGPDLPPFYTADEDLAQTIARHAADVRDPLWRMPFWEPYNALFESGVADMNNASESGFAGSITAALFLKRFVEHAKSYVHFDIYCWTPMARPGFPKGGEAQGIRALFALLAERYAE